MSHKLGIYYAHHHDWPSSWDYIARLQPPVSRILMPGDHPTDLVSRVYRTAPNAVIPLRWWDIDDGGESNKRNKLADPERAAEQDAITYLARIETMERVATLNGLPFPPRRQLRVNGLNEPPTWEHDKRPAVVRYNVRLIERMRPHQIPVYAGCLAVGHPEEWLPVWDWAQPMIDAIKGLPGSALELHEYWQLEGPNHIWGDGTRKDWGALAGRYQRCPFDVPIVIGECGADGRLYDRKPRHTGWVGNMTPETYAGQLGWYLNQIDRDRRIVAALPFLTDYQADEWGTFDTTGAHDAILRMIAQRPTVPASEEHSVHIPVVGGPTPPSVEKPTMAQGKLIWPVKGVVTQRWGERASFYQEKLGIPYHNGLDIAAPEGERVVAIADGVIAWVDNDPPGYGNYVRVWHPAYRFHSFVAHLRDTAAQRGQAVKQGDVIGYVGSTGMSTGPHVHFEIRLGTENSYAPGTYGHKNGRVDPQTVYALLGV